MHTRHFAVVPALLTFYFCGCFTVPTNYSTVTYPDTVFGGRAPDTSFPSPPADAAVLHHGDTLIFGTDGGIFIPTYQPQIIGLQEKAFPYRVPSCYFKLSAGDTFYVYSYGVPVGQYMILPGFDTANVGLISADTILTDNNSLEVIDGFVALRPSKGDIQFELVMTLSHGNLYSTENCALARYCIGAPDTVFLQTDSVSWNYLLDVNRVETKWILNRLFMEGTTNAFGLSIKATLLDNTVWAQNYSVDPDGHFSLSYEPYWLLKALDLVLHSGLGPDRTIRLKIPK
jgi:hypothetical protein